MMERVQVVAQVSRQCFCRRVSCFVVAVERCRERAGARRIDTGKNQQEWSLCGNQKPHLIAGDFLPLHPEMCTSARGRDPGAVRVLP
jgi:hypothetical protein